MRKLFFNVMNEEYKKILEEHDAIEKKLGDPQFLSTAMQSDIKKLGERFTLLQRAKAEIEELARAEKNLAENEDMLQSEKNEEMLSLARTEKEKLQSIISQKRDALRELLYPDPDATVKKMILEIRAGAGGDEASLFAGELLRMYRMFVERQGWSFSVIDSSPTSIGGYKEVVAEIEGTGAYHALRQEMGVHRVQRVPETEKTGRVHTSTISVAILPEAGEVAFEIKPSDIEVEFFRSSGPGGQNVNKVETAVRITHTPSGLVVASQQGRSQLKNRENAMALLRTKLLDAKRQEEAAKRAKERKEQIGTADRSEKIRTYNFPQDRITDHRIKESWHNIQNVMEGNMEPIVEAFRASNKQ